jgi:ribulose-5-phosphate 4-epimerase/fuculose-1-phosphate aldolase
MTNPEGVIKFALEFTPGPPLSSEELATLNAWRAILYRHRLIGQDPARYGGYGYGNISQRMAPLDAPPHYRPFAISGTQTGEVAELGAEHYALVLACFPEENRIVAQGPIRPSSESLTHGTLYDLDATLRFVMHAHSPEIWRQAEALNLPITGAGVPYGSPAMAAEVRRLFAETEAAKRRVFAMGGHEDGIVAFGRTAEEAGEALLACLR